MKKCNSESYERDNDTRDVRRDGERDNYTRESRCEDDAVRETNHSHTINACTECENNHKHDIYATTGPAIRYKKSHVHKVNTVTSTDFNHNHQICDTTSTAIYNKDGSHYHILIGETSCERGHDHDYEVKTSREESKDKCDY